MVPPADFKIDDPNFVASLDHPLKEMMRLVGPPFNPIGLLQDQNAHGIPIRNARGGIEGAGPNVLELGALLNVVPVLVKPAMDLLQAVLEILLRLVVQDPPCLFDRRQEPVLLVPVPSLFEDNPRLVLRKSVHPVREVEDLDLAAGREVDRFSDCLVGGGAREKAVDDVPYVSKVAGFLARSGNRQGRPLHCPVEEVRNYVAVLPGNLPGAVAVEKPRVDDREVVEVVKHVRIQLSNIFVTWYGV